jgi:succinate-semialdehyde dehydrogenase / glutarate-semialdehyde dehydrogenase
MIARHLAGLIRFIKRKGSHSRHATNIIGFSGVVDGGITVVVEKQTDSSTQTREQNQIAVINPVTGETIGILEQSSRADIQAAVERARSGQHSWERLGVKERCRILGHWVDLMWENQQQMMLTIRAETGKNDAGAFNEVIGTDIQASYYSRYAPRILKPRKRPPGFPLIQSARVYYKPYGVVGFITPWNYPLLLAMMDIVPALAAGNAIVIKPSEIAPYSTGYAIELMHEAGIPQDVAQIISGDGNAGAALVDYVDYICFTGSTAVGRKVAVRAAKRLIPCALELGGKDAMIVLADTNLDIAASALLMGACENAGQACASIERAYVEASIYDSFILRVREYAKQMQIGSGDGFDVDMGSLTNERELLRAEEFIQDAVGKGAEVIFGGKRRPELGPLIFEPTVLINVDHTMRVMREETFGPLVPIMRVADADEAVRLVNDCRYGLSGSIYTSDLKRGEELATRLDTGDICVNRVNAVYASGHLPTGGQKESGLGRRGGPEGLLRFVTAQSILVDTQIGSRPALKLVDPTTLFFLKFIRQVRRILPLV